MPAFVHRDGLTICAINVLDENRQDLPIFADPLAGGVEVYYAVLMTAGVTGRQDTGERVKDVTVYSYVQQALYCVYGQILSMQ